MVLAQQQICCRPLEPNRRLKTGTHETITFWHLIKMTKPYTGGKSASPTSGAEKSGCLHLVE